MSERFSGLMLLGLGLWTAIGSSGLLLARARGETRRFRSGLRTLGAVWLGYLVVLVGVSLRQGTPTFAPGQDRCFGPVCFAVTGTEELQGFWARGQERERLLRVLLRMHTRGTTHTESEQGLAAYLIDDQGRHWEQVPGLGGVRLSTDLPPGATAISEPVFRVSQDATGMRLVLHHTGWTTARLKVGNAESWLHRPAEMTLPAATR